MKKSIQKNSSLNSPFALFTKAALSKTQQGRLKGGADDNDDDGIIVEDVVEG